jgi:membrane protein
MKTTTAEGDARGRAAEHPSQRGAGWKDVLSRVRRAARDDQVGLLAAGVAFYAFFALFPALAALVALYGLVSSPAEVAQQVAGLSAVLPSGVQQVLRGQLERVAGSSSDALGWGLGVSVALALWGASKGVRGLVKAMNAAYDAEEERGFLKQTGLVLLLTLGGLVATGLAVALVAIFPAVFGALDLGAAGRVLAEVLRWAVLAGLVLLALAVLYRYGPARPRPRWRRVAPGALFAALAWLLASVALSLYVSWFGSYQQTFGSLAAVAVLLMWFFVGALAIVLGAEINAAAERRTRRGTTAGGLGASGG